MNKKQQFKVESGVPIVGKIKAIPYPFDKMKLKDSFLIPTNGRPEVNYRVDLYAKLKRYNKSQKKGIKLTTRKAEGGLRVWRIK